MRFVLRPLSIFLSAILVAGLPIQAQSPNPAGDVQELHLHVVGASAQVEAGKPSQQPLTVAVTDGHGAPVPSATVLFHLPADGATGVFSDGSRVAVLYTDLTGQVAIKNIQWGTTAGTAVIRVTATKGSAHAGMLLEQAIGSGGGNTSAASRAAAVGPSQVQTSQVQTSKIQPRKAQPGQPKPDQLQEPVLVASATDAATVNTPSEPPSVVVNNNPDRQVTGASGRGSKKKWLWIGIGVAVAAGAAVAFTAKGSGSSPSAPAPTATTVGSPTVSIGHP
jgi:hypothetical protein